MQTYSDEYIEHWAEVYLQNEVSKRNVHFEAFLFDPQAILDAIISTEKLQASLDELDSLMTQRDAVDEDEAMQEEADKRFERDGHLVETHGNTSIERIQHRDCPKKWKTNTSLKTRSAS